MKEVYNQPNNRDDHFHSQTKKWAELLSHVTSVPKGTGPTTESVQKKLSFEPTKFKEGRPQPPLTPRYAAESDSRRILVKQMFHAGRASEGV
jgi:hypothetical protein